MCIPLNVSLGCDFRFIHHLWENVICILEITSFRMQIQGHNVHVYSILVWFVFQFGICYADILYSVLQVQSWFYWYAVILYVNYVTLEVGEKKHDFSKSSIKHQMYQKFQHFYKNICAIKCFRSMGNPCSGFNLQ